MKVEEHGPDLPSLQPLVDLLPALIHTGRPDGYLDFFNQRWLTFVGLRFEDLEGWKWTGAIHPDDVTALVEKWRAAIASGEPFEAEARVRRADGEYRWMLHRKLPLRTPDGVVVKWFGSSSDIEDYRRADDALRRSEAYLSEAERLSHVAAWAFDPATARATFWSEELFRIYGLDPQHGIPTDEEMARIVHPDDRARLSERVRTGCRENGEFSSDFRIVLRDGTVKWIHTVWHPVFARHGALLEYIGIAADVTTHKRAADEHEKLRQVEAQLRRTTAYLTEAQRISHTGSFGWRPSTGEVVWSEETFRIFRQAPTRAATIDLVLQRVHPDDAALVRQTIEGAARAGQAFDITHRLLLPDGTVRTVHVVGHTRRNDSSPLEFIGAVTDVTATVEAEDRVRQNEVELRQLVDAMPQHVFVLEAGGRFIYANQRDLDYTGLTVEDVLASDYLARVFHPDDVAGLQAERARAIVQGVAFEAEARLRRFDGQFRWFLIRLNPLRDADGRILRWYGTRTDIEDRKRAETALRQQEREMRQILDLAPQHLGAFDANGTPVYANRAMLDYFGLTLDEWIASGVRQNVHRDDVDAALRFRAHMADREVELRLRRHDGTYRWFLVRGSAIRDDQGRLLRQYVAAADIDDRKQAEQRLRDENVVLREDIDKASMLEEIVGASAALHGVLGRLSKVARTDSTVLITGETGTGKELVARAIHRRSARAFVSVNCAATPRELIASELFGHEKGAFTGATQRRMGRFELAHGGTIFLDEVGELPPETQVALLRVLQEREFERVGGGAPIRVDVRVIAATNRDLSAGIEAGTFRSDLFYRLNVFPIAMPSLRERADDIPMLVEYFINRSARNVGKTIRRVSKKTIDRLKSYPWPGNVRELQNVIERSVIVCDTDEFSVDESWLSNADEPQKTGDGIALSGQLAVHEKAIIEEALRACEGRVFGPAGAAARLGIPRSTLESKIRALRINKRGFRPSRPAKKS
jgi:PAS domain S-box-containing protein